MNFCILVLDMLTVKHVLTYHNISCIQIVSANRNISLRTLHLTEVLRWKQNSVREMNIVHFADTDQEADLKEKKTFLNLIGQYILYISLYVKYSKKCKESIYMRSIDTQYFCNYIICICKCICITFILNLTLRSTS